MLPIYFNECNNIIDEKKEVIDQKYIVAISFLKVVNMVNGLKNDKGKVNQSRWNCC